MNRSGLLLVSALALGGYAQVAVSDTGGANWSLSGWLNEGLTRYSDGAGNDVVQTSDNITGGRLLIFGAYQNYSLEVEGSARARATYGKASDLPSSTSA